MGILLGVPFLIFTMLRTAEENSITNADHETAVWANYIGDASFALTGALTAGNTGMDLLGVVIVGFITALGGGTIRDTLLGNTPLFWLTAGDEITLCAVTSTITFFSWPYLSKRFKLGADDEWLFWTDAIGVGVFAATGAHTASTKTPTVHLSGCAICGMITATFGGLTRDILCQRPPRILYSTCEVYAPCGLLGGYGYMLIQRLHSDMTLEAILFGTWVGIMARVVAYNHFVILPTFRDPDVNPDGMPPDKFRGSFQAPYLSRGRTFCGILPSRTHLSRGLCPRCVFPQATSTARRVPA